MLIQDFVLLGIKVTLIQGNFQRQRLCVSATKVVGKVIAPPSEASKKFSPRVFFQTKKPEI